MPSSAPAPAAVRAVVVTWNGAHLLPSCLGSLLEQEVAGGLEVLVVDNGSHDGTAALLRDEFPTVRVLQTGRNLGFAGGAARGTSGFTGDHLVLLNNDARFEPGAVQALVDCAQAPGNEHVGAVTAKVMLEPEVGGPVLVNSTGLLVGRSGAGSDRDWLRPAGTESTDPEVFGFCGAAALLRRTALDDVGTFDERLFLYYEDTDLSWRLRAGGWTVRHEPRAVAWHLHAASSDAASPLFRFHNTRNSLVVVTRHAPARVALQSWGRQTLGLVRAAASLGPRDPAVRARARGLVAALRLLPTSLRDRRELWRGAVVPRGAVGRLLGDGGAGR